MPQLLYADDVILFAESEIDEVVGSFDDMYSRRMLKVNANTNKVLLLEKDREP